MSKKKGMSLEDKRTAILEVFHETSDVFTLKDIEKLGTKKGVVTQTIKDVLQSLVDDDLVRQDKIGISNFFWSFPGEAGAKLTRDKQNLERQLESLQALKRTLETELAGQMANKENTEERQDLMRQVAEAEALNRNLSTRVNAYADNDPENLERMKKAAEEAKVAANRYMDNIYGITSWAKKSFGAGGGGDGMNLNAFFESAGLTDSLDYVE